MSPDATRPRAGRRDVNSLTPPATIAAVIINKELTPQRGFIGIGPLLPIRLVNGSLMAKLDFSKN
jgi:hypothetical protein